MDTKHCAMPVLLAPGQLELARLASYSFYLTTPFLVNILSGRVHVPVDDGGRNCGGASISFTVAAVWDTALLQ